MPLGWAATHNNLGNAHLTLGERESGTERLEEAVAAFHAALEERTRERVPLAWAESYGYRGIALMIIAGRTGDLANTETAMNQIAEALETARDGGHAYLAAELNKRHCQSKLA